MFDDESASASLVTAGYVDPNRKANDPDAANLFETYGCMQVAIVEVCSVAQRNTVVNAFYEWATSRNVPAVLAKDTDIRADSIGESAIDDIHVSKLEHDGVPLCVVVSGKTFFFKALFNHIVPDEQNRHPVGDHAPEGLVYGYNHATGYWVFDVCEEATLHTLFKNAGLDVPDTVIQEV